MRTRHAHPNTNYQENAEILGGLGSLNHSWDKQLFNTRSKALSILIRRESHFRYVTQDLQFSGRCAPLRQQKRATDFCEWFVSTLLPVALRILRITSSPTKPQAHPRPCSCFQHYTKWYTRFIYLFGSISRHNTCSWLTLATNMVRVLSEWWQATQRDAQCQYCPHE